MQGNAIFCNVHGSTLQQVFDKVNAIRQNRRIFRFINDLRN